MMDENATSLALREECAQKVTWQTENVIPFSSKRKWGAVSFTEKGTYLLGAPEVVLAKHYSLYEKNISSYMKKGRRVLVFAHVKGIFKEEKDFEQAEPMAFFVLKDCIRKNAKETLKLILG